MRLGQWRVMTRRADCNMSVCMVARVSVSMCMPPRRAWQSAQGIVGVRVTSCGMVAAMRAIAAWVTVSSVSQMGPRSEAMCDRVDSRACIGMGWMTE